MPDVHLPRVRALDGLRGLAVAAVVVFHAGHLDGGYLGVDVFFVLSGYLITTLVLRERAGTDTIALRRFWARRARRLLPAAALMLLAVAIWARTADPEAVHGLRGDALATLGYVANWHAIFSGHDYWSLFRSPSPLEHTWSLAIEEQFYVVWPLLLLAVARLRPRSFPRAVLGLTLVGAAGSWLLMQLLYDASSTARAYYGTDTRAGSILLGAALACALAIARPPGRGARVAIGAAGVAGLAGLVVAAAFLAGDDPLLYRIGFLACATGTVAVIATSSLIPHHPVTRVLSVRPLVGLGLISYGVYLWHWPVDVVLDADAVGLTGWPLIAVQCAVTLALALASYFLVEQPIRRGWGSTRFWQVATPALAVAVTVAVIAGTAVTTAPAVAAGGFDPTVGATMNTREKLLLEQLALARVFPASTPRIMVTGDSVGFSLAQGANQDRPSPFAVAGAAMIGCGITPGDPLETNTLSPQSICSQWPTIWQRAIGVFHPKAIVLLTGVWEIWPRRVNGNVQPLYSRALTQGLQSSLDRAARIARTAGIPLVVLTVPCLHPSSSEIASTGDGIKDPRRVVWLNRQFRSFASAHPDVKLIDLGTHVCRTGTIGPDGVHFSAAGARAAWRWLTPQLAPLIG